MKSYLVTFTATTRVVTESDAEPKGKLGQRIVDEAVRRIKKFGVDEYLNWENAEIIEDTECPAGEILTDKLNAI